MMVWWYGMPRTHVQVRPLPRAHSPPLLRHTFSPPPSTAQFYGFARTNNQKGITIPSQRRFIYYWHQMLLDTNHYEEGEDEEGESLRGSIMARRSSAFIGVDMETLKQAVETVMPEV